MHKIRFICVFILAAFSTAVYAQDAAVKTLTLDDLSGFKNQSGNWQIVGDVTIDPTIDVHHPAEATPETGKKKKKSKSQPTAEQPKAVTFQAGKGVLLNINTDTKKDHLVTTWEHGDIELELEVMLPKGSNSGIYLQGRYEIQLFDSWGVRDPKFSDIGGIYRNWETEPDKIYMGKAPLSNPAKAPGLWQKMKISFRAPRFDASGKKIASAKFLNVTLNGVKIHENVAVPLLTGGPLEKNEKPTGPLMIQGDHGAIAFRNMKYKLMKDVNVVLSDITYKTYYGDYSTVDNFISAKPALTGSLKELTCEVSETDNAYALSFAANLTVPEDAKYEFTLLNTGGSQLIIDGNKIIDNQRADANNVKHAFVDLKAGTYPVIIHNFKNVSWLAPRLALYVNTPNSYPQPLHAFNSFPPEERSVAPIFLNPGNEIKLLRAFIDFKGKGSNRLTHTIAVGDPSQIHYAYDLKSGNLACVWRGDFVDATPMWHERGDGSFIPRGAVQFLFMNQPLAFLTNQQEAFPVVSNESEYRSKGYEIEEGTGHPVFHSVYRNIIVTDKVYPDDNNRSITHEVKITNEGANKNPQTGLFYKLAEGSAILAMSNGLYAIDDKQFYIKVSPELKPIVRVLNGKTELITPFDGTSIKYSIIW